MSLKLKQFDIPTFRKLQDIQKVNVGKKITIFSGLNGIGKSNILSLIASGSGVSIDRASGSNFQPKFTDYFIIEDTEDYEQYKVFLNYYDTETEFNFTKRISFKNDTGTRRGIRTIPRTNNYFNKDLTVNAAAKLLKRTYNIGPDARVSIPTVFLSLSRLFPLGEGEVSTKNLAHNNSFLINNGHDKFKEWYNFVLPSSIDISIENIEKLNKKVTNNNSFYMTIERTSARTQSVGQDNLGNIISALVDFYILSLQSNYNGGILCIDEIEASLHPSAQLKLFDLLINLSEELNLQIFLSSHSLTFLKEIIKFNLTSPEDFELIYFKDTRDPMVIKYKNYRNLKADLFDEQFSISPKVKIYCEDETTKKVLDLLLTAASNLNILNKSIKIPQYEVIPVYLGCNQLLKLPDHDKHFQKVGIVLDGDARMDRKIKISEFLEDSKIVKGFNTIKHSTKIVFLPGFLAPESFLYSIIYEYINNQPQHRDFWRFVMETPDTSNFTSARINQEIIEPRPNENKDLKQISEKIFSFCESTNLLTDYYKTHINELETFILEFTEMVIKLQGLLKAEGY